MESPHDIVTLKEQFSNNKYRYLTKAHLHITTNGYIIDVGYDLPNVILNSIFRIPVLGAATPNITIQKFYRKKVEILD